MVSIERLTQDPNQPFDIQCFGDSTGTLIATVNGGTGVYTYEWTDALSNVIGNTAQINDLTAGTYCVTATDEAGCQTTACYTVTQPDQPLTVTYTTSIYHGVYEVSCPDATDGSIDVTVEGGTPGYSFNWLGSNVDASAEDQTGLAPGLYQVLVVDTNSCTVTLSITLDAPESTLIGATLSTFDGGFNISCNGACDGTIDANILSPFSDYTLVWNGPSGFVSVDEDLADLCAGDYTITVVDSLGCSYDNTFAIAQPEVLVVDINPTLNCETGELELCASVTGGSGNYNYQWSQGASSQCIIVTEDGEYCVDVVDSNGCTASACFDADPSLPFSASQITTPATCGLCNGAIDITVVGGAGPYDFTWTGADTDPNAEDQTDLCAGAYSVQIIDANDCVITLNSQVQPGSAVDLTLTGSQIACFGNSSGSVTAILDNATEPVDVSWFDSNNNLVGTDLVVNELPAGTYTFNYVDAVGCEGTGSASITQVGALDIEAVLSSFGEYNISEADGSDGSIDVTVTGGTNPYTYQWTPAVGDTDDNLVDGLIAGTYSLTVVDENGCTVDTVFTLTEPESLGLPTGLSPNGDGQNDFYVIPGVLKCEENSFKVFNRWGNLVYESSPYANEWYGQSDDGGNLADGTYFVIFTCDGEEFNTYVDLRRE